MGLDYVRIFGDDDPKPASSHDQRLPSAPVPLVSRQSGDQAKREVKLPDEPHYEWLW